MSTILSGWDLKTHISLWIICLESDGAINYSLNRMCTAINITDHSTQHLHDIHNSLYLHSSSKLNHKVPHCNEQHDFYISSHWHHNKDLTITSCNIVYFSSQNRGSPPISPLHSSVLPTDCQLQTPHSTWTLLNSYKLTTSQHGQINNISEQLNFFSFIHSFNIP
jgi:hypothetical protein